MEIDIYGVQRVSADTLLAKYAKGIERGEKEIFERVATGIAAVEPKNQQKRWAKRFFKNMTNGAIGAGRIMSAAGAGIEATVINCFVQPIGDAIDGLDEDGLPGIYDALRMAAETMRRGGGVGYDFSRIRPSGANVKSTASAASGPCSYIDVFDASCKTVVSAGARRGAQMGVMRIDHPDILEFIQAKRTSGRWNNFNVSVFVSDEFMQCKMENGTWELVHKARPGDDQIMAGARQREDGLWIYRSISAVALWEAIMKSNYDFAEPGVLFESAMNMDNNLRYIERLEATNPCAEQCLPAYGCCCLGQLILPKFVKNPFVSTASFDFKGLAEAVVIHVRFLDNTLDATMWPLAEQKQEAVDKRRIGLGFTGLGNALAMLGLGYNTDEGRQFAAQIARTMRDAAYVASVELAKSRGAFPKLDVEKYLENGTFASRLPEPIKGLIREHGIRNSHLLSIAPTGTVSLAFADNASNGIEPPFSLVYSRFVKRQDGSREEYLVIDHGFRVFLGTLAKDEAAALTNAVSKGQDRYVIHGQAKLVKEVLPAAMITALEMSVDDHLGMLKAVGPYIDSSISKTVNVPADYPFEDFKSIYDTAYNSGLKGVATYRPNSILGAVLQAPTPTVEAVPVAAVPAAAVKAPVKPDVDPLSVVMAKRPEGSFESVTTKVRYHSSAGDQSLYVSVSFTKVPGTVGGETVEIERPLEVFIQGSVNGVANEWVAAYSRNLSLLARAGLLAKALQDALNVRSDRGRVRYGWYTKNDGTKVPRFHESEVACIAYVIQEMLIERGLLDDAGNHIPTKHLLKKHDRQTPMSQVSALVADALQAASDDSQGAAWAVATPGARCKECGAHAVIKKDGCDFCTNCGDVGSCG